MSFPAWPIILYLATLSAFAFSNRESVLVLSAEDMEYHESKFFMKEN